MSTEPSYLSNGIVVPYCFSLTEVDLPTGGGRWSWGHSAPNLRAERTGGAGPEGRPQRHPKDAHPLQDARTQNVLVPEDVRQAVYRPAGDVRAAYLLDLLVHGSLAELLLEAPDQLVAVG